MNTDVCRLWARPRSTHCCSRLQCRVLSRCQHSGLAHRAGISGAEVQVLAKDAGHHGDKGKHDRDHHHNLYNTAVLTITTTQQDTFLASTPFAYERVKLG